MWDVFSLLASNLDMSLENIVLIVFVVAGSIFYAKSFFLGAVLSFFGSALLMMLFIVLGLNWVPSLVVLLLSFVLLCFLLFFMGKAPQNPYSFI